jgi:acetyl esterase/lipase
MDYSTVDPQLRHPVRRMANLPLGNPLLRWFSRKIMPLVPLPAVDGVFVERVALEHARLIIYRPEQRHTDAALLWIHGGGYLGGAPLQDHEFCAVTAREMGMVVVSVQYRLSPEPVFERAHPDCMEAWGWMQKESARLAINAGRVVVGGQSAGGGLAAGVTQHICDEGPGRPLGQ